MGRGAEGTKRPVNGIDIGQLARQTATASHFFAVAMKSTTILSRPLFAYYRELVKQKDAEAY